MQKFFKHPFLKTTLFYLILLLWVFVVLLGVQFLVYYLFVLFGAGAFLSSPLGNTIYGAITYTLSLIIIIFVPKFINKKWRTHREELGLKGWPTWTDIGLAPIAYIAATLLALIFTAFFSLFPWFDANESQDVGYAFLNTGPDRVIAFIMLVVIAPIAEEIIFRGWLYGKLRTKLDFWTAAILTSLLFGLVHFQWNVGVNVFAMSMILCLLREITGTTYSGILVHMLKNGIAFYLLYIIGIV